MSSEEFTAGGKIQDYSSVSNILKLSLVSIAKVRQRVYSSLPTQRVENVVVAWEGSLSRSLGGLTHKNHG